MALKWPPVQDRQPAFQRADLLQGGPTSRWSARATGSCSPRTVTDPDKVDPPLPDSGASDLKGSDFESLALDDVETQPKDASIHAFRPSTGGSSRRRAAPPASTGTATSSATPRCPTPRRTATPLRLCNLCSPPWNTSSFRHERTKEGRPT